MREGVAMKKEELRKLILTAKGAVEADVVIKNCKVVNVFTGESRKVILPFPAARSQVLVSIRGKWK